MDLPISNGMDLILVFNDRMTKMCHFIPYSKSTTAPEFAWLFISYFSGFTACLTRLSWTVTWYLLQISGLRSLLSSKSTLTNLQCSILKQMVKLNGWIKHLKRTFGSFATMNKMIDLNYCHLLSLLTIMVCKNPLRYHLSSVMSAGWAKLATNQRPTGFCLILYQIGLQLLQSK